LLLWVVAELGELNLLVELVPELNLLVGVLAVLNLLVGVLAELNLLPGVGAVEPNLFEDTELTVLTLLVAVTELFRSLTGFKSNCLLALSECSSLLPFRGGISGGLFITDLSLGFITGDELGECGMAGVEFWWDGAEFWWDELEFTRAGVEFRWDWPPALFWLEMGSTPTASFDFS